MAVQADHAPQSACPGRCPGTAFCSCARSWLPRSCLPRLALQSHLVQSWGKQADLQVKSALEAEAGPPIFACALGCQDRAFHASPSNATSSK
eukprot:scaffold58719_cov17-Tisochrysis_lutea.AAC.1